MHLKPGWEAKILAIKPKVYPLAIKSKYLVDDTFDEIQHLSQFKYTTSYTFSGFLVFIVHKIDTKGKKKEYAMVNIHKLNDLVFLDANPLFLQLNIIASF